MPIAKTLPFCWPPIKVIVFVYNFDQMSLFVHTHFIDSIPIFLARFGYCILLVNVERTTCMYNPCQIH